jgi:hypothetical protein
LRLLRRKPDEPSGASQFSRLIVEAILDGHCSVTVAF